MKSLQNYVRDAAVHALDQGSERIGDGEKVIHRLVKQWRSLDEAEKRQVMEVIVAIGGAAVAAATAYRDRRSKTAKPKKAARKAGDPILKKVAKAVGKPLKKAMKK